MPNTGFPRVTGHPQYNVSGSSFIPEIWSGKLLKKFYDATLLTSITNTDYEGEIKDQGDRVIIRTIPTLTINTYVKGQKLNYERPESTPTELLIDKGFYWAFAVDDVDKYQSDLGLMEMWSNDASMQLKIQTDKTVLQNIYDDVATKNKGTTAGVKSSAFNLGVSGSPVSLTASNIIDYIIDCGTVLDEQNIQEDGRFFVMSPKFINLIKKSDIKDASLTGDGTSPLRNGRVGMIDRFTLYSSNLLLDTTDGADTVTNMIFGHKQATTFVTQITKSETLRAESTFGDLVRGLMVFGYKVLLPESLGWLYAKKG